MAAIYTWGIQLIEALQSVGGPFADIFFKGVTFLGDEEFLLLLFPLLYWCLDAGLGTRLALLFLVSGFLNYGLKDLFTQPRPFVLKPGLNIIEASGYGLPSGHAQTAFVIWGSLALTMKKCWSWVIAGLLILLIGLSRIYLGVHFPTDVLAGWLLGALLLFAFSRFAPAIASWGKRISLPLALGLISVFTALALALDHNKDTVTVMAAFWGFTHGVLILTRLFADTSSGSLWKRIFRFPVGLVILVALYLGLKLFFPEEGEAFYLLFRFVRYALLGLWIGLGAPLAFRVLGLGNRRNALQP